MHEKTSGSSGSQPGFLGDEWFGLEKGHDLFLSTADYGKNILLHHVAVGLLYSPFLNKLYVDPNSQGRLGNPLISALLALQLNGLGVEKLV